MSDSFRTTVNIVKPGFQLDYQSNILFMGSCFASNMGQLMAERKFNTEVNPFGACYNPASILACLQILYQRKELSLADLGFNNGLYYSFFHHSDFSNANAEVCLNNINTRCKRASEVLLKCDVAFITFGTSWVFEHKALGQIVSNCHKLPAAVFNRRILTVSETEKQVEKIVELLLQINNKIEIVLTVSPIRHLSDGAAGNMLSKARLITAVHAAAEKYQQVGYFPSFEIMLDDLRDYRFYNADMVHPSDVALQYIWQKFADTYIEKNSRKLIVEVEKIITAAKHRPLNPQSIDYIRFCTSMLEQINNINKRFPQLDLSLEKHFFERSE
jgi:hypothetical protein